MRSMRLAPRLLALTSEGMRAGRCLAAEPSLRQRLRTPLGACLLAGQSRCTASGGARIRRKVSEEPEQAGPILEALRVAQLGPGVPLQRRRKAITELGELASHPRPLRAAEDALHNLLASSGEGGQHGDLQDALEEALWGAWHSSGDGEIDELLRQGCALMEKGHNEQAVVSFSEAIGRKPDFVEAWNKRATARFLLKDLDNSIADCRKVLDMKPRHFGCLAGMGMVFQAKGEHAKAVDCFEEALRVHPGLDGPRRLVQAFELEKAVNEYLRPQIVRVAEALSKGGGAAGTVAQEPAEVERLGLTCDWDVHRVKGARPDPSGSLSYFFRVRVRNLHSTCGSVQSLARFYALRFPGGRIFPLVRRTAGKNSFDLAPNEEYRFCFHLSVKHELEAVAGGMLLKRGAGGDSGGETQEQMINADLLCRAPAEATEDEVERWRLGHQYKGVLHLQHLDLEKSTVTAPRP